MNLDVLPGLKTKLAALIALAVPINEALKAFGLPHLSNDQVQAVLGVALSLGLYGIRKSHERAVAEIKGQ